LTLPPREEVLERERRWLRPAGLVTLLGVVLFAAGTILQQVGVESADSDPEQLVQFHENEGQLLAGQILRALGLGLFAVPLYVLFKAAEARAERVRGALVGFCLIGPVLFAVATIVLSFGIRDAADAFVEQAPATEQEARQMPEAGQSPVEAADDAREELADDVVDDSGLARTAASLQIPGILSLLFALVYTCLWATRTGLLTRFWGSLGMALGVALILLGTFGLLLTVLWFAMLGFRFTGISRSGLPPAWAAGEAMPWDPPTMPAEREPERGEGDVEGSGRELSEPALPEDEAGEDRPVGAGPDEPSSGTEGRRPRKRKRRQ
jgi:hypothetical protein